MTKKPTVSIIIPVLNEEAEISGCIDSFKSQLSTGDEILVVDNGSTDKTKQIVSNMGSKYATLLHEPKKGTGYARRLGFDEAKGEVLIRIDADSRASSGWLKHLKLAFSDDNIQAWSGYVGASKPNVSPLSISLFNFMTFPLNRWLSGHNNLFGSNMALRKVVWDSVKDGVRDSDRYWEDLEIASDLARRRIEIHVDNRQLVNISYRGAQTSISRFFHRMLGWPRTYWSRNKTAAVLVTPFALFGFLWMLSWRLLVRKPKDV